MENPTFAVERILWLLRSGSAGEDEIRRAGHLLGISARRAEALEARYSEVFSRFVEKRCSRAGEGLEVCIYSWNRRRTFKAFPASMYSTGTVILFSRGEPVKVLSNPMPKALDYHQALELLSPDAVPFLASNRVDGWQVNAYYDELLGRWIFSTRYVLHNMYFSMGRLRVDPYGEVSNPIVALADAVARERGLYRALEGLEGWTLVFVLAGPEPASVAPPYPVAPDPKEYNLILVAARKGSGELIPGHEAAKHVPWERYVEPAPVDALARLHERIKDSMEIRSVVAWLKGEEDPLLVEIPSIYYRDAVMVKHLRDAKSASILCSEGLCDRLSELVEPEIRARLQAIREAVEELSQAISKGLSEDQARSVSESVRSLSRGATIDPEEILREASSGNVKRIVKKILALALEERSLASEKLAEILEAILRPLRT